MTPWHAVKLSAYSSQLPKGRIIHDKSSDRLNIPQIRGIPKLSVKVCSPRIYSRRTVEEIRCAGARASGLVLEAYERNHQPVRLHRSLERTLLGLTHLGPLSNTACGAAAPGRVWRRNARTWRRLAIGFLCHATKEKMVGDLIAKRAWPSFL